MLRRVTILTTLGALLTGTTCCAAGRDAPAPERSERTAQPSAPEPRANRTDSYPHGSMKETRHGDDATGYWLYVPQDPVPEEAPVVVFLHGGGGTNPHDYGGWIRHLARSGSIVVYPIFQESKFTKPPAMLDGAAAAIRNALDRLESGTPRPLRDRVAHVGHSVGGGLAVQLAAEAESRKIPVPGAVLAADWTNTGAKLETDWLADVPSSVLLVLMIGEDDQFGGLDHSREVLRAVALPDSRKAMVVVASDERGPEPLIADHTAPLSPDPEVGEDLSRRQKRTRKFVGRIAGLRPGETDALDRHGFWRVLDELMRVAWKGGTIDDVVGKSETMSMGTWPDGRPVAPMRIERAGGGAP